MVRGTIVLESLREGSTLSGFRLVVSGLRRERADLSPAQVAAGFPRVWSEADFEVEDPRAEELAERLSEMIDSQGWYANFSSRAETYVIYPGRVFRYPRNDPVRRAEAQAYGRTLGIPDRQLEWTE